MAFIEVITDSPTSMQIENALISQAAIITRRPDAHETLRHPAAIVTVQRRLLIAGRIPIPMPPKTYDISKPVV